MNKEELINKLRLEIKRANQRLVRLERQFGKGTWGAGRLEAKLNTDRLQAWTEKGRVRTQVSKMSLLDLQILDRAVNDFLSNKMTSTVKGVKQRISKLKQGIEREFEIESDVAEEIYSYFDDDNFKYLLRYYEKPSDFINEIMEAKEKNESLEEFEDRIKKIVNYSNNSYLRDKVISVYNEEVK